jgi:hypothetical protein
MSTTRNRRSLPEQLFLYFGISRNLRNLDGYLIETGFFPQIETLFADDVRRA